MARKKKHEEHENHERWLISYADFITLLFAFFVVMYSVSSVNEGKYRVLSDTLVSAFDRTREGLPIKLNNPLRPPIIDRDIISTRVNDVDTEEKFAQPDTNVEASKEDKENFQKITQELVSSLKPLIDQQQIEVVNNELWVEIKINSNILFPSGIARVSSEAVPVLGKIAATLQGIENKIQVEGFTDNVPIDTDEFTSNWELSSARAASVVHLFTRNQIKPQRLSAVGYGEYRPIAGNDTAEGRAKNRRINVIVLSDAITRVSDRDAQLEKTQEVKAKAEQAKVEQAKDEQARAEPPQASSPPEGEAGNDFAPVYILPPIRQDQIIGQ
jgi:chemotaxis protein MotB